MSTALHYDAADLALFAMRLLPPEIDREIAAHVEGCSFCRQEFARLRGDLASYAYTVEMQAPPAIVRERVLNQVLREKKKTPLESIERAAVSTAAQRSEPSRQTEPAGSPEEPVLGLVTRGQNSRQNPPAHKPTAAETKDRAKSSSGGGIVSTLFLWLGWIAVAGLAVTANNLYHEREADRSRLSVQSSEIERLQNDASGSRSLLETMTASDARHVLLTSSSPTTIDPAPQGHIIYVAESGALIFLGDNLEPLQLTRTYELWLIPADGRDPIPSGTFHPDQNGHASVILPPLPRAIQAKAFGVTIEDEGGSQSPTMPIVLAGS